MNTLLYFTADWHLWLPILEKFFWCGFAALGFAVLFNVPPRTLFLIAVLGATGGMTKFILLSFFGLSIVISSLCGAIVIGILSIPFAYYKHAPPLIFYTPAIIPMIPGIFAYKMMIGLVKLTGDPHTALYQQALAETVNNFLKVLFVIMSLSVGVIIPMLITRKESVKELKRYLRRPK